MKSGRIIKIENQMLLNLRNALRTVLLESVDKEFKHLINFGTLQISVGNRLGVKKVDKKIHNLDDLSQESICVCKFCRKSDRDAVYVKTSFLQCWYPPRVDDGTYFWLCPQCYEGLVGRIDYLLKEGIVWFQDYDREYNIKDLGAKDLREVEEIDRDGNLERFLRGEYSTLGYKEFQRFFGDEKYREYKTS